MTETMDMGDPRVQAELEADKRAALARLATNPGTFLWNYGPGDTVVYEQFGGRRREVRVEERHAEIKNGEPGFNGDGVWGYDRQIIEVRPGISSRHIEPPHFRPDSRNTCPYPGCDEPRAEEWPMTCPAHSAQPETQSCHLCGESLGLDAFDVEVKGYTGPPAVEMYDAGYGPWSLDTESFLVHQPCGEAHGWKA